MSKAGNEHSLRVKVSAWLAEEMRHNRLWYIKLSGSRFQRVGAPDYIVVKNGKGVTIELKDETDGKLSPAQEREMERVRTAGKTKAWVLTSLEAVKDAISSIV